MNEIESQDVEHLSVSSNQILIVKQGVYEARSEFNGVVLVRNPLSIFASLISYDSWKINWSMMNYFFRGSRSGVLRRYKTTRGRLLSWMKNIDEEFGELLNNLDTVELYCAFYNRRMLNLRDLNLPIVRYEDFVIEPEMTLRALMPQLGLKFETEMLTSEKAYSSNQEGHGKNDLSRSVDTSSLHKYRSLDKKLVDRILALTYPTWSAYGYMWDEKTKMMRVSS
ncbi:sulfotransferase [Gimesia chilikensis]|uniref:sulfotransferase n=1 Tax=Gimesia chilikensis TaxID=2605989 RepID=UPI0011A8B185|nr:sulfotransferase [Gimesia chilikensis]